MRWASQRSIPRVGTATTSAANGSASGCASRSDEGVGQAVGTLGSVDVEHPPILPSASVGIGRGRDARDTGATSAHGLTQKSQMSLHLTRRVVRVAAALE